MQRAGNVTKCTDWLKRPASQGMGLGCSGTDCKHKGDPTSFSTPTSKHGMTWVDERLDSYSSPRSKWGSVDRLGCSSWPKRVWREVCVMTEGQILSNARIRVDACCPLTSTLLSPSPLLVLPPLSRRPLRQSCLLGPSSASSPAHPTSVHPVNTPPVPRSAFHL